MTYVMPEQRNPLDSRRTLMMNKPFQDHSLSRLMLGTVQLGMPYGVANTRGQPDYRRAVAILEAAIEGGGCFSKPSLKLPT